MNGIKIVNSSELTLLGAPIFSEAINAVLEPKLSSLKTMTKRLLEIDNHEAFFLERHCFTIYLSILFENCSMFYGKSHPRKI